MKLWLCTCGVIVALSATSARAQQQPDETEPAPDLAPAPDPPAPSAPEARRRPLGTEQPPAPAPEATVEEQDPPVPQPADEIEWEDEEPPPLYIAELRKPGRLVLGFGIGVGAFDALCDGCRVVGGLSIDVFGGWQLTSRIAVGAEVFSLLHVLATDGNRSGFASHTSMTASARVWLVPKLWISVGVGAGMFAVVTSDDSDTAAFGPGAQIGFGGETDHGPTRGIDLAVRFCATVLDDGSVSGMDKTLAYSLAGVIEWHWN